MKITDNFVKSILEFFAVNYVAIGTSLVAQLVKSPPAMKEILV